MDLHGLRVREARELMNSMIVFYRTQFERHLRNLINNSNKQGMSSNSSSANNSPQKRQIVMRLIVGRGLHSIENKAVLGTSTHPPFHHIVPFDTYYDTLN